MGVNYNNRVITDGLVLYLDAANPKSYPGSGTTWFDLSGYNYNGTLTNGPSFNADNKGYFLFDGANDYVPFSTAGLAYGASPSSILCWAYPTVVSGGWRWIMSYGNPGSSQSRFLGTNGTDFYYGGYGNDIAYGGVTVNTWFHLAGVYDGSTAYLYINGTLVTSAAKSWNTIQNNAQLGRQTNGGEYWSGRIAFAQIYNRTLNASEVIQNFYAHRSRFGI